MSSSTLSKSLHAEKCVPSVKCFGCAQNDMNFHHLREIILLLNSSNIFLCSEENTFTSKHVAVHLSYEGYDFVLLELIVEDGYFLAGLVLELGSLERVSDNDGQRLA